MLASLIRGPQRTSWSWVQAGRVEVSDGIPLCKVAIKKRNSMDTADQNGHRIQTGRRQNKVVPFPDLALTTRGRLKST